MTSPVTTGPEQPHLNSRTVRDIAEHDPAQVDEAWCRKIFRKLLQSLELQYAMGMPHRAITPDTVVFHDNGEPLLLPSIVSDPEPAVADDLTALGALVHFAITRELAPTGPLLGRGLEGYSHALLSAVDFCMSPDPDLRPQSIDELRDLLGIVAPGVAMAAPDAALPEPDLPGLDLPEPDLPALDLPPLDLPGLPEPQADAARVPAPVGSPAPPAEAVRSPGPLSSLAPLQAPEPLQAAEPAQAVKSMQSPELSHVPAPLQGLEPAQAPAPVRPLDPLQPPEPLQSSEPVQSLAPLQSLAPMQVTEPPPSAAPSDPPALQPPPPPPPPLPPVPEPAAQPAPQPQAASQAQQPAPSPAPETGLPPHRPAAARGHWPRWSVAAAAGAALVVIALAGLSELRAPASFDGIARNLPQTGDAKMPPAAPPAPAPAAQSGAGATVAAHGAAPPLAGMQAPAAASGAAVDGESADTAAPGAMADDDASTDPSTPAADGSAAYRLQIQPWGIVYVDGVDRGVSPPVKRLLLAPGRHTIRVANPNFQDRVLEIDTANGDGRIAIDFSNETR